MQKLFSDLDMQKIVLSGSLTPPLVMPLPPSDFTLHAYPLSIVQVNVQSQLLILVPHTHAPCRGLAAHRLVKVCYFLVATVLKP